MYKRVGESLDRPLTVWTWLWHDLKGNRQIDSQEGVLCF